MAQTPMTQSSAEKQRLRRAKKAQGLIHVRGWVSPKQAEAIDAIMANEAVDYRPVDDAVVNHSGSHSGSGPKPARRDPPLDAAAKKPRFQEKPDHPGAWTVWVGRIEIGTVYKHLVDEDPRPVTVWIAYRNGGHSSRHETRQHAAEALMREYKGFF